jgi:hypothetical protein
MLLIIPVLLITGCSTDPEEPGALHGTWVSEFDERFTIDLTKNTLQHDYVGEFTAFCFEGNIHQIVFFNSTTGIIFIEYTDKADWWVTKTGNFTGIYFRYLTNTTVELANAAAGEWPDSYTPTTMNLPDAKTKFTVDTVSEYFSMTSACVKQ